MQNYSREKAIKYASDYAMTPNSEYNYFKIYNETGGDCTNFVSQCLHAGGFIMDFNGRAPWWYRQNGISKATADTCSMSWSNANSLYWCLKMRNQLKLTGIKGMEVDDMSELELGDIIFYENLKGIINHSALITDIVQNIPYISQHSVEAFNIPPFKPTKKKMHFVKII